MRLLLLLAVLLGSGACTQPRSKLCKEICAREYECITSTNSSVPFDEKECIAACSVLEADQDNLAKVQKHAECVRSHTQCKEVLECQ